MGVHVAIATSHGGHLELLEALRPAFDDLPHAWVTPPSAQAEALAAGGERVVHVTNPWRSPVGVARCGRDSVRALRALRPRAVLSPGAGAAVPFCLAAKATGARLVFVETMARTEGGSVSGRVLYRFADHFLVQWPELLSTYPRAEVCRPALLEDVASAPAVPGRGTFVSAGSHGVPFDRLIALVDEAAGARVLPAPVVVQGSTGTYAPRHVEPVAWLEPEQVRDAVAGSAVVVSHGGSGLISLALRHGRRPLVLPRRGTLGEHFDDHQVAMAARLARLGLVVSLDEHRFAEAVPLAAEPPGDAAARLPGAPLAARVRELLR